MNCYSLLAISLLLTLSYKTEILRYLQYVEDNFFPLDQLDVSVFADLEETEDGFVLKGTDTLYHNCTWKDSMPKEAFARGWSKLVHVASPHSVVKTPNLDGKTFMNCFYANFGRDDWEMRCRMELLKRFVNEIKLLIKLRNIPTVIEILSYCIPKNPLERIEQVNIITERGDPLDIFALLQLTSSQKHELFVLMKSFFVNNPDINLRDFTRQQVVLVNGQPKIVDFDDAYINKGLSNSDEYRSTAVVKLQSEILMMNVMNNM
ncbi:hypothetical protein KIN20_034936 [Parelaphostrongylus tenuis]|uniref:Uncharacterized protein n=1 Tax=Parelaphostrongylus tenuis TaxID=148309 RepID=A0AAD5WK25_PARTN|nr:hypothetical protein KIN20_034936 [Parelaphostrongylus tenuis]